MPNSMEHQTRRRVAITATIVALGLAVARTVQDAHRHECPLCGRLAWHLDLICPSKRYVTCPTCMGAEETRGQ